MLQSTSANTELKFNGEQFNIVTTLFLDYINTVKMRKYEQRNRLSLFLCLDKLCFNNRMIRMGSCTMLSKIYITWFRGYNNCN
jgi:hypothetical protein